MAQKVSQFPASTNPPNTADLLPIVQGGVSKQTTLGALFSQLAAFLPSGIGGVARTVQAKEREIISITDFGAVGDDSTDNTTFIANALAAAAGKALFIPQGTFRLSTEAAYNLATSGAIMIFGLGPQSILKPSGTTNKGLHISATVGVTTSPLVLKDFAITVGTSGTCAAALHLDGLAHWLVDGLWIDGSSKTTTGIQCTGSQQGQVSGGGIINCTTGALLESTAGVFSNGIDWHGMTFVNTTTNFKITGADDVFFHGNHLTSASMQIDVTMGNSTGTFTANHLEGASAARNGMIVRAGRVALFGNSFIGTATSTDLEFTGGASTSQSVVLGNLINANLIIGAGINDTTIACNALGGTCTDSGTRTRVFGNRAYAGTDLLSGIFNIADVYLARDAADTLALRNGSNSQVMRVYNTFTDASNYQRWQVEFSGGRAYLTGANAGSGAALGLTIRTGGDIQFQPNSGALGASWQMTTGGALTAVTDASSDIGAFGANRPATLYVARSVFTTAPNTQTGATYTVALTDNTVIANKAGTITMTLPAVGSSTGRKLRFVTIQNQTVVSNASNVVPLAGGAAGTAILAGTAGKWAELECDGANWIITASN